MLNSSQPTGLDQAITKIAAIAHVPARRRAYFAKGLRSLVSLIWKQDRQHETEVTDLAGALYRWENDRIEMIDATSRLREAALQLKSTIAKYDSVYGKRARLYEAAPAPIDELLARILRWMKKPRGILLPFEMRERGRPAHSESYLELIRFLLNLQIITIAANGGRLTFDKNRVKGSLIDAARLLAPYLPPRLVPPVLSTRAVLHSRWLFNKGTGGVAVEWFRVRSQDVIALGEKSRRIKRNKNSQQTARS